MLLLCGPLISNGVSGTVFEMALKVINLHLLRPLLMPSDPAFLAFAGPQAHNLYALLMPMPETNFLRWD